MLFGLCCITGRKEVGSGDRRRPPLLIVFQFEGADDEVESFFWGGPVPAPLPCTRRVPDIRRNARDSIKFIQRGADDGLGRAELDAALLQFLCPGEPVNELLVFSFRFHVPLVCADASAEMKIACLLGNNKVSRI